MEDVADFGADIDTGPFDAAMADMKDKTPKALMWSLREGGRAVIRASRAQAPVYTGRLRDSIKNARNIKGDASGMVLWVGPFGPEVALYSGKMQGQYGYMQEGAAERAGAAAQEAISKAFARYA